MGVVRKSWQKVGKRGSLEAVNTDKVKRHRIPKSKLQAPKTKKGLVVTDIPKYYWATQLRRVPAWSSMFAYSKWMETEKLWVVPMHPNSLLWSTSHLRNAKNQILFLPQNIEPLQLGRCSWGCSKSCKPCIISKQTYSFHAKYSISLQAVSCPYTLDQICQTCRFHDNQGFRWIYVSDFHYLY